MSGSFLLVIFCWSTQIQKSYSSSVGSLPLARGFFIFSLVCLISSTSKSAKGSSSTSCSPVQMENSVMGQPQSRLNSNILLSLSADFLAKDSPTCRLVEVDRNCLKVMILPTCALGSQLMPLQAGPTQAGIFLRWVSRALEQRYRHYFFMLSKSNDKMGVVLRNLLRDSQTVAVLLLGLSSQQQSSAVQMRMGSSLSSILKYQFSVFLALSRSISRYLFLLVSWFSGISMYLSILNSSDLLRRAGMVQQKIMVSSTTLPTTLSFCWLSLSKQTLALEILSSGLMMMSSILRPQDRSVRFLESSSSRWLRQSQSKVNSAISLQSNFLGSFSPILQITSSLLHSLAKGRFSCVLLFLRCWTSTLRLNMFWGKSFSWSSTGSPLYLMSSLSMWSWVQLTPNWSFISSRMACLSWLPKIYPSTLSVTISGSLRVVSGISTVILKCVQLPNSSCLTRNYWTALQLMQMSSPSSCRSSSQELKVNSGAVAVQRTRSLRFLLPSCFITDLMVISSPSLYPFLQVKQVYSFLALPSMERYLVTSWQILMSQCSQVMTKGTVWKFCSWRACYEVRGRTRMQPILAHMSLTSTFWWQGQPLSEKACQWIELLYYYITISIKYNLSKASFIYATYLETWASKIRENELRLHCTGLPAVEATMLLYRLCMSWKIDCELS